VAPKGRTKAATSRNIDVHQLREIPDEDEIADELGKL